MILLKKRLFCNGRFQFLVTEGLVLLWVKIGLFYILTSIIQYKYAFICPNYGCDFIFAIYSYPGGQSVKWLKI